MIEGMRPGPRRTDPVGVAPAEVVELAVRCERLEAVAEAARAVLAGEGPECEPTCYRCVRAKKALRAALVAAGADGKAGT